MQKVIVTLTIALLFGSNLAAKEISFNPYEPAQKKVKTEIKKKVVKKVIKKVVKPKKTFVKKTLVKKTPPKKVIKSTKVKKVTKKKPRKVNRRLTQHLDKIYKKVQKKTNINQRALREAFAFYKKNKSAKTLSSKYLAIADYTKTAHSKRLYIINLNNGVVHRHKVAHGKYSGSVGGKVRRSSNRRNSKMTPYGFFKVGSKVGKTKKKGYKYLSVKGLERSNKKVGYPSRMGGRDVIMHPAKYVSFGGRSHGCFAIRPQDRYRVFSKLKKALLYSYTGR